MHWMNRLAALLTLTLATLASAATVSDGQRRLMDLPYGNDPRQRIDVYLPAAPKGAPMLLLVHGGAWMFGNRRLPTLVDAKVAHWVDERGFIVVSAGYRMVPQVDPLTQARDIAQALALAQSRAASWGGDADRLVLVGHSAGAHLVALLSADPALAAAQGARPWRGTVVLDSAAIDTESVMTRLHMPFYDRVFGGDPAAWRAASPTAALTKAAVPTLVVCSTQRRNGSCVQSQTFVDRARALGAASTLLPQDLDHEGVNAALGPPGAYTRAVDAFIDAVSTKP